MAWLISVKKRILRHPLVTFPPLLHRCLRRQAEIQMSPKKAEVQMCFCFPWYSDIFGLFCEVFWNILRFACLFSRKILFFFLRFKTHTIHVWYVYLRTFTIKSTIHVGKHTSPMDGRGEANQNIGGIAIRRDAKPEDVFVDVLPGLEGNSPPMLWWKIGIP